MWGLLTPYHVGHVLTRSCAFINLALEMILAVELHVNAISAWQEKGNRRVEKTSSSRSTAVTSGLSWQRCLSLVFLSRPRQGKALLLSTAKERVRPPQDLSFYGDGRRLRGKQSGGNAEEKVLARSDPLFAVGDVLPEAGVLNRAWGKYVL